MIEAVVQVAEAGRDLSQEQMSEAIGAIMEGKCTDDEIARFLVALHKKGETVAEVAGAAVVMREKMTRIRTRHPEVIDVVGTGGDRSGTFNISTAAALVTAAAGAVVAKHGSRRYSSRSGSADVLTALGVNVEIDAARVEACLDDLGICFCFAPFLHKAMKHVAPIRQRLGMPTIFNILGPLVNPASATFQLLGVGRAGLRPLLSEALALLGAHRVVVVHGSDGLDEVTLGGTTDVTEVAGTQLRHFQWTPADFGFECQSCQALQAEGPEQSAAVIRGVLEGRTGPARDIVMVNAAAALWTARRAESLPEAVALAGAAIDSGRAASLLGSLVEYTNR
ncbi:MAG: anthranilate phosphoribosyltransferase [Pirellulales bacterium]|nr:anthranilate phosphoribosyltransferase [Pirellulales bacterium]